MPRYVTMTRWTVVGVSGADEMVRIVQKLG